LFLGRYLVDHDVANALSHAASSVYGVLKKTKSLNAPELALIAAQNEFNSPSQIFLSEVL